jgi:hypothetical protein
MEVASNPEPGRPACWKLKRVTNYQGDLGSSPELFVPIYIALKDFNNWACPFVEFFGIGT